MGSRRSPRLQAILWRELGGKAPPPPKPAERPPMTCATCWSRGRRKELGPCPRCAALEEQRRRVAEAMAEEERAPK